jgi:hypothetical protein
LTKENKVNLPKELVLDYKIWRSGGPVHYLGEVVGQGDTQLLNNEGYMCCLGQFCEQAGVPRDCLEDKEYPDSLSKAPKLLVSNGHMTDLAGKAAEINDCHRLPTAGRVVKLQKLFKTYKKTIVLKNFPEEILKQIEDLTTKEKV